MEPVTQGQFFEQMRALREDVLASHQGLQQSQAATHQALDTYYVRLTERMDRHERDHRDVADRVLIIETERAAEAKVAMKRSTWAGMLAGGAISLLSQVAKNWTGHP